MEAIELIYRPVGQWNPAQHAFILYTDSNNKKFAISGFPQGDPLVDPGKLLVTA